jgi:hypothetical protein
MAACATYGSMLKFFAVVFIGGGNRIPVENQGPAASHWQTLSHNVVHLLLIEL